MTMTRIMYVVVKEKNVIKPKEILDNNLIVIDCLNKIERKTVNRNSVLRSFTSNYVLLILIVEL